MAHNTPPQHKRRGATATGYGLVVGLIAITALGAVTAIGDNVSRLFGEVSDELGNVITDPTPTATPEADTTAPTLLSITRENPTDETTGENSVTFRALFSEDMQNVGTEDWDVSGTTATVTAVNAPDAATYDLTVAGGDLATLNATISISIASGHDMADVEGNPLPSDPPATNESYTISNPSAAHVYYQCAGLRNTGYVVFARNTDNRTIASRADVANACSAYGLAPLGTSSNNGLQNWGYNGQVVEAIGCFNCYWSPSNHNWNRNYDHGSSGDLDCTHVSGTGTPNNGDVLVGMVLNSERSNVGCYGLQGNTDSFASDVSLPEGPFQASGDCSNSGSSGVVNYTGTSPEYILCASSSAP